MGKYRIYPNKSNTLLEGSEINTGLNEVMELWYGLDGVSRHLVRFDFSDYMDKYTDGRVPHITATTATIHMQPCYPIYERYPYADSEPAESSQIDVKVVQQYWDGGIGHDFYGKDTHIGKSNWYSATSTSAWALHGGDFLYTVFSGIAENGHIDFSGTVADEIELWNMFTGQNYGFVVKFSDDVEALTASTKHILKYFSNNAFTKYRMPYIELDWDNQVTDERDDIIPGSSRRLYLYLKRNGTFENANSVSGCVVAFSGGAVNPITASTINNPLPGIYFIDITYPSVGGTGVTFTDSWSVKYESGMTYTTVVQTGVTKAASEVWNLSEAVEAAKYTLAMPNILDSYSKGDSAYLRVDCYTPFTSDINVLKTMEYRIELIDGNMRIPLTSWDGVSYTTTENFIILDTSWLFESYQYALTVRYSVGGSQVSETLEKKFWIV